MKFLLTHIFILFITGLSFGQTISSSIPNKINKLERYMFYLHGRIIEEQGPTNAIHPQFGLYEYRAVLDTLKRYKFNVISEARPKDTDVKLYAEKVSNQIDTLLRAGVQPENIFVLGASKGAFITLWVSVLTKNSKVNFIVMGVCSSDENIDLSNSQNNICGNFLSIYESSDTYATSCNKLLENQPCVKGFKEVELKMNIGHGFLYKPYKEWIDPIMLWANQLLTGADQVEKYLPYLKGKRVGMVVNQTAIINSKSLVDSLLLLNIDIKVIFGPEHGFRSNVSNGANVLDEIDTKTNLPVISLYGKKRKPSKEDMDRIDIMIFDIQDVGCRFYTNINKLYDVMEACAEFDKELIILDRPNPNGYVDGPVLDMNLKSGIGKFPVPITHGMTIGEFAQMINGEGWLPGKVKCRIKVIKIGNYSHDMSYTLPVNPSPNLNSPQSVLLYPSLCLFEGTAISQGRGTYTPFAVLGSPDLKGIYEYSFTPTSISGLSETPLYQNKICYGLNLQDYDTEKLHDLGKLNLKWLMEMYEKYPIKELFFDTSKSNQIGNFDKLAGTTNLKNQIIQGVSEAEIRKSWEPQLSNYKVMRKKYLLYK